MTQSISTLLSAGRANVVAQFLLSGANVFLSVAIARGSSLEQFGTWAVVYTSYLLTTTVTRVLVAQHELSSNSSRQHERIRGSIGLGALLSVVLGAIYLLNLLFVQGEISALYAWTVLGAAFSGVLEVFRAWLYILSAGLRMVIIQAVPFLAVGSSLIASAIADVPSSWIAATWAISLLASSILCFPILTKGQGGMSVFAYSRELGWQSLLFVAEKLLMNVRLVIAPLLVAAILGPVGNAGLRGVQTIMGPHSSLMAGLTPSLLHRLSRKDRVQPTLGWWTVTTGVSGIITTLGAFLLPSSVGHEVLGEAWGPTRELLLYFGFAAIVRAQSLYIIARWRVLNLATLAFRARLVSEPVALAGIAFGSAFGFPQGLALGLVFSSIAEVSIFYRFGKGPAAFEGVRVGT